MAIEVKKYDLPDYDILKEGSKDFYKVWIPDQKYLVIGQANKAETSLFLDIVEAENIPVYKRPSGGETVILTPNTIVISSIIIDEKFKNPSIYFQFYNKLLMDTFQELGIENIGQKGISDVTIGNKKIVGSSIYRRKNVVFYHAVINLKESIDIISKYIKHPQKEPDYRKGRDHKEFVTSISQEGYDISTKQLSEILTKKFEAIVNNSTTEQPF